MLTLVSLALASSALAMPVDEAKLARTYAADQVLAYAIEARVDEGGQDVSIDAEVVFKVKKTTDAGAEVAMSVRKFAMVSNGSDTGSQGPEEMVSPFDKLGLPHVMSTQNEAWIYILTAMAGFVPGKEVELGKDFGVSWQSNDKALSISGKGKASEVDEPDGVKAYKLEYDVEVKPGEETPGQVKIATFVNKEGSLPIRGEGSVNVDNATIKFKVKRLKS